MAASSKEKTAFFVPDGKKHFLVMPMGILSAHAFFVCVTIQFKKEWHELYKRDPKAALQKLLDIINKHRAAITLILGESTVKDIEAKVAIALLKTDPNASVIVDNIMLFDTNILSLITYFRYRVTVNLRKTRFLPARAEFVGRGLLPNGNTPAQSKYSTIEKLCPPASYSDIQMINGLFGWYSQWIPHLEEKIQRWRTMVMDKPKPGECTKEEEAEQVKAQWESQDDERLDKLKQAIVTGPILKRPNPKRRFFLKTDWPSNAMGAVLLQAGTTEEAEESMRKEIEGGKCKFDKSMSKLRLRPIAFISRICKGKERDYHSFVGEAATGRWAMKKFRQWLIGKEFTWITDCSGLTKFFEGEYDITHTLQLWKLELLAFIFTIVHRPAKMLTECDLLSRYEGILSTWRNTEEAHTDNPIIAAAWKLREDEAPPWPRQHLLPTVKGDRITTRTELAQICDTARATWIIGRSLDTIADSFEQLGGTIMLTASTSEEEYWQLQHDIPNIETFAKRLVNNTAQPPVEWLIVTNMEKYNSTTSEALRTIIRKATTQGATQCILMWTGKPPGKIIDKWEQYIKRETRDRTDLQTATRTARGSTAQADIDTEHTIILTAGRRVTEAWSRSLVDEDPYAQPGTIENAMDAPNESYTGYFVARLGQNRVHMVNSQGHTQRT
ncbi:unnamed protein product [Cylindrotheca closterium]|uniref:Reverse transcriptase RNase H-like domain-containing protein n=1 Tax=Cylindrotheca closterium TaxID=2856 RepID=A0AAD2G7G6_9STRA|nr:unnamed protein product [Cylindrotheca closterium]